MTRTGDRTPYEYSLEDHLIEKWGIESNQIYDPADDEGSQAFFGIDFNLPKVVDYEYDHDKKEFVLGKYVKPENGDAEILLFDLRYSIDRQLDLAKELLKQRKEERKSGLLPLEKIRRKKGFRSNLFPRYIQAYDALQVGASNLEIAKHVFPERKVELKRTEYDRNNARNSNEMVASRAVKAGEKLVNGGYKNLLKLS